MAKLHYESPLAWPEGLGITARANQKNDHGFVADLALEKALGFLAEETADARFESATLFLDIEQPLVERLRRKVGNRSGACLKLKCHGQPYALACDRWQQVEHNIYALHLALRQMRNIERWGVGSLPALLHGFGANVVFSSAEAAPSHLPLQPWMEALGLGATATLDDAIAVYHRRAKAAQRNSDELMHLNLWMEEARAHFAQTGSK